ncbi:PIN domain-containing protein [Amylibacter sp.]|nr:PIN domain-containing protein [Amylibacter sp.]MDB0015130.1 PIN domain-containing protein [Amylibacter sp.]MDB3878914.1 PIN domain-containing protein [Amylibacter sp.]MDC1445700.1 PIN domain-containing protein [Amylibacter sp.]
MRVLLDTCVIYPSILRSILLGVANEGLFSPLWSERIIEEWRRAAQRNHNEAEATIEIALLRVNWPKSQIEIGPENKSLFLPDENDIHVLQAAIEGNADELLTANLKDFPTSILSSHGIIRRSPDDFLLEIAMSHRTEILKIIETVKKEAIRRSGISINNRKMLKSSRLPKLAKFIAS